jgi:prepilin signal peptidase PulO-like enzyme (type II secretory pathway)
MIFGRYILVGFLFFNFFALVAGTLLTFLLTSWRARLTWIDWAIALLPNLLTTPILLRLLINNSYYCEGFCSELVIGGFGFVIGLPLGLLCSKWVIAGRNDPEIQR